MFFNFKDDENGVCRFDRVAFWNIPNKLVDGPIKDMYEKCADLVKNRKLSWKCYRMGRLKIAFQKKPKNVVVMGFVMLDLMEEWRLMCLNYRFQIN